MAIIRFFVLTLGAIGPLVLSAVAPPSPSAASPFLGHPWPISPPVQRESNRHFVTRGLLSVWELRLENEHLRSGIQTNMTFPIRARTSIPSCQGPDLTPGGDPSSMASLELGLHSSLFDMRLQG